MLAVVFALAVSQSSIDTVLSGSLFSGSIPGICVTTLDGKDVYSKYDDIRLAPASNQKILTAVYASSMLGMDYRPTTKFWKESDRLIVEASGDPTITLEALRSARKALAMGKDIAIYVRQPYRPLVPPSWEYDDLPNRYAARVTAFSFDKGGWEVWTDNGKLVALDPAYKITLRHIDGSGSPKVDYRPEMRLAVVTGRLPAGRQFIEAFAIPDPDVVAARVLGGTIVNTEKAPPARKPDFVIQGPTLREMLKECLEKSDNNMAEHILLMAATRTKPLGSAAYSDATERMLRFYIDTVGLSKEDLAPVDGSGMSRHNMVTPRAMCKVLAWAHRQSWQADFLRALASGGEGTLASRLGSSSFVGKTGTLSAVTCLSGYVHSGSGQSYVVSMLFNNTIAPANEVRAAQDRIIAILERG